MRNEMDEEIWVYELSDGRRDFGEKPPLGPYKRRSQYVRKGLVHPPRMDVLREALQISTSVFEHVQRCADWLRGNHRNLPNGHSLDQWIENLLAPVLPRLEHNPKALEFTKPEDGKKDPIAAASKRVSEYEVDPSKYPKLASGKPDPLAGTPDGLVEAEESRTTLDAFDFMIDLIKDRHGAPYSQFDRDVELIRNNLKTPKEQERKNGK